MPAYMLTPFTLFACAQAQIRARQLAGKMQRRRDGTYAREDQELLRRKAQLEKPLAHDRERDERLRANEARYLQLALDAYRRCLEADATHDTEVGGGCCVCGELIEIVISIEMHMRV